jgi:hypothetical protein
MSGSNPGFTFDEQPTAAEWNLFFSGKQDWSPVLATVVAQGGVVAFTAPVTWIPTDASGANLTFTNVNVTASTIGNMAFVSVSLTYPTTANTDIAKIGSLPFAVPNQMYAEVSSPIFGGFTAAMIATTVKATSIVQISTASNGLGVQNVTLSGGTVTFQIVYPLS